MLYIFVAGVSLTPTRFRTQPQAVLAVNSTTGTAVNTAAGSCTPATLLQGSSWGVPTTTDRQPIANEKASPMERARDMEINAARNAVPACDHAGSHDDCCHLCTRRLGCTGYTFVSADGTCCLRTHEPVASNAFQLTGAVAGTLAVQDRCNVDCELSPTWADACFGSSTCLGPTMATFNDAPVPHVDMDMSPWLKQMRDKPAPEPPLPESAAATPPRVAVCAAGEARSLVHPAVYSSLYHHLLEGGKHDLFMVLGTESQAPSASAPGVGTPSAAAFEVALRALSPKQTRFYLEKTEIQCFTPASKQWVKWAHCGDIIRKEEQNSGVQYDWVFRTRPDVVYKAPMFVGTIAARIQAPDVVITHNDWHMFVHRSKMDTVLKREGAKCDAPTALHQSEYAQMMKDVTAVGGRHIETCWPAQFYPAMHTTAVLYVSHQPWLSTMCNEDTSGRLARWSKTGGPKYDGEGTRVACKTGSNAMGIVCEQCKAANATGHAASLPACPPGVALDMPALKPAEGSAPPLVTPTAAEMPAANKSKQPALFNATDAPTTFASLLAPHDLHYTAAFYELEAKRVELVMSGK